MLDIGFISLEDIHKIDIKRSDHLYIYDLKNQCGVEISSTSPSSPQSTGYRIVGTLEESTDHDAVAKRSTVFILGGRPSSKKWSNVMMLSSTGQNLKYLPIVVNIIGDCGYSSRANSLAYRKGPVAHLPGYLSSELTRPIKYTWIAPLHQHPEALKRRKRKALLSTTSVQHIEACVSAFTSHR